MQISSIKQNKYTSCRKLKKLTQIDNGAQVGMRWQMSRIIRSTIKQDCRFEHLAYKSIRDESSSKF